MSSSSSNKPKSKDPVWEHGSLSVPNNMYKVMCKHCSKVMHGITRLRFHLVGIAKDVSPCIHVPEDVRKSFFDIVMAKARVKEQKIEEVNQMREEVNLSNSEGEESDGGGAANIVQIIKKQSVGVGPMDSFCKLNPEEARKKGAKVKYQSTMTTTEKENKRNKACEYIAQWFYEAGIAHNTVTLASFDRMLEAIGDYGRSLRGPTPYELGGPFLQKCKKKVQRVLLQQKVIWELTGCSIMTDGWTDKKGRGIMNLMVHSAAGVCFVRSIDASSKKKDGAYIFDLVDSCIREIGEKNVVQVVTDTARPNQAMGAMLRAKWPHIYWTGCAAHCIDLMLEDIGGLPNVRDTIAKAKVITVFLYAHTRVLCLMREHLGKDIVRTGITRFATAYLNLKSLLEMKSELRKLFRSDELNDWGYLKKDKGKRAARIVRSDNFWQGIDDAIKLFEPLVVVLRRVDGDTPAMGFLYGELINAKREIAERFDGNEVKFKAVLEIVDKRWSDKLKTPLHLAGYYLNPYYYNSNRLEMERNSVLRGSVASYMETVGIDEEIQDKILQEELEIYRNSEGSFGHSIARKQRNNKNFNPATWWSNHGSSAPHLQSMAVKILSLTCSSSGCERNWSTFEQVHTKKRARLLHMRLNDLVFIKFNSKLFERKYDLNRDPIEIKYADVLEDENNEWINNTGTKQQLGDAQGKELNSEAIEEVENVIVRKKKEGENMVPHLLPSLSRKKRIVQVEEEEEFVTSSSSEEADMVVETNNLVSGSESSEKDSNPSFQLPTE